MASTTEATPTIGEYSPKMIWDTLLMTNSRLEDHCRVHKEDIDNLYSKIDKNHRDQQNDSTEIKQSLAEISQSVSLLAQKIDCAPPKIEQNKELQPDYKAKYAWITGAVIAVLFGVSQFWEYIIKR